MALGQPLLDAGIMPLCIMAPAKGTGWFISSVYPASAGLFNGIVLNAVGESPEACVAAILAKLEEQWEGL